MVFLFSSWRCRCQLRWSCRTSPVDANGNGDALQATSLAILDTGHDGDGKQYFRDLDSDNDSILDPIENGFPLCQR